MSHPLRRVPQRYKQRSRRRWDDNWLFNTFPQNTYQNVILSDQPIGMWPMRFGQVATGTNEVDYSGQQKDLTWTTTNPAALNVLNNAGVTMTGDRECTRAAELWQQNKTFTCEWWMIGQGFGSGLYAIFDRRATNDRWAVYVDATNGRIQFNVMQQGGVTPATALSTGVNLLDGGLYHCVVEGIRISASQSNFQFYVNGIDRGGSGLFSAEITTDPETFRLCGENATRRYIGQIAYCAFYNYALTQQQAINHFLAGVGTWVPEADANRLMPHRRRNIYFRRPKRIDRPIPLPPPPPYPVLYQKARVRTARPVRRGKYQSFLLPQINPPYPHRGVVRARTRRNFLPRRGLFIRFVPAQVTPPGALNVKEPISGVLVTDGRTSGILVTDGTTTGVLLTDGRTTTVLIT